MLFLSCFIHWKSILYCFSSLALGGWKEVPSSLGLFISLPPACLVPSFVYYQGKPRAQFAHMDSTTPEALIKLEFSQPSNLSQNLNWKAYYQPVSISQSVSQSVKRDWNRSEHTGGDWYMIKIESENLKHQKQHRFGLIWIEKMTCFVFSLYFWLAKSTKSTFGFCFKFSGGHPPPTMTRYFPEVPTPPGVP